MDIWFLLGEVLMLLGAAFIMGALAQRLRQSPIVGYLLAGMVLGPILFNRDAMLGVAELGVALLLFSIGLEFSFNRLKSMGTQVLAIGLLQICVTIAIFCVGLMLLYAFSQALVLGAIVALSSTAVVLRVLVDRVEIDSVRGRYALGILLLQDVAVVPMVLLVTILSPQGNVDSILMPLIKTLAATAAMVMVFYLIFFKLMPVIFQSKGLVANRELFALLVIVVALGSTWAAHAMKLSPALGAFLAGMLLGESPFATQIRADIGSIRTLFVTLFFTSVGMLAEPVWLLNHITLVVSGLGAVFIGKSVIIYLLCRLFKISDRQALATGITLAQVGEFSFVLANIARAGGAVSEEIFDLIISVSILSLLLSPYMVNYALPLANAVFSRLLKSRDSSVQKGELQDTAACELIIIGFGPAGQRIAEALLEKQIHPRVIELNPKSARKAEQMGLIVYPGDATHSEVLLHAGILKSAAVVVTVPDPRTCRDIIKNIRLTSPGTAVIARGRYQIAISQLKEAGASSVIDEENAVGGMMAQNVLDFLFTAIPYSMACGLAGKQSDIPGNSID
ncbi:MAG: cation:proton antiporter [Deltaproteobacteria bacterium]|jgi:CPA2 family monovalent cation:H+ antiporter-2|nr:cation:proton antiporter [Deltaproteobacteria bacterium]MBW2487396.1 cation:proton antiporter [Deltaproteobacteria bacterium]